MSISKAHLEKLQDVCAEIAARIHCAVSVMGAGGVIVASSIDGRIGKIHEGAARIVAGEIDEFELTAKEAKSEETMLEGCSRGIDVEGRRVAAIGLAAPLETARTYATIAQICIQSQFESFAAKEHLEHILSAASAVSIIAISIDGLITTFNSGAERMLGYRADDVVGKETPALFHMPEEIEAHAKAVGLPVDVAENDPIEVLTFMARREGYEEGEWSYVRKDASRLHVTLSVSAITNETGDVVGFLGIAKDVTKRHKFALALKESETRFRNMLDATSDWYWETDKHHRFSWISKKYYEVSNTKPEDVLGKTRVERQLKSDLMVDQEKWKKHQEDLDNHVVFKDLEYSLMVDGKPRYWSVSGVPNFDEKGAFLGYSGTGTDITKRKLAENELKLHRAHLQSLVDERTAKLQESENRFRTFAESMSDWLWEMDADLRFTYFTDGFDEHVGISAQTFIGHRREELIDPSIPKEVFESHLSDINNHREFTNFTYPYRRPDGALAYIRVSGKPIFDEEGTFKGYRGTGTNATKEVVAEKALADSERRFKDIAQTASDWFWETDKDHHFTFISDRFFEVANISREDILGKSRLDLISEKKLRENPEKWEKHRQDLIEHKSFELQYWFDKGKDTRVCIEIKGKPVYNQLGEFEGYRGAGTDVTEAVELQDHLRMAKELAEEANKAKSEFLSNMSHELRTPLNAILGFAQLLEFNPKEPLTQRQKGSVQQVKQGGEHLLRLVNDILDLSKIEAGKMAIELETLDLKPALKDCFALTKTLAETKGVSVIDRSPPRLPSVFADHLRLKQVLLNLLSNAVKYNKEQGSVWVDVETLDNRMVRLSVTDNGLGISEENQSDLFQPFQRLGAENSGVEGTGIGLVLTKRLVEEMNGIIGYESCLGEGSAFWVDIPLAEGSLQYDRNEEDEIDMDMMTLDAKDKVILYVEDNQSNLVLMNSIIDDMDGICLISAKTAEEGIVLAKNAKPDFIILDINLPGMDGIEAVKTLKADRDTQHIDVIALSADAMPATVQEGLNAGFKEYLTKPLDIAKFMTILDESLGEN